MRSLALLLAMLVFAASASAQGLSINPEDTTRSILAAHKGKRVSLRLRGGDELSGVVRDATERLVVIGELSGREFFDAVVPLDAVDAVIVRVRTQ